MRRDAELVTVIRIEGLEAVAIRLGYTTTPFDVWIAWDGTLETRGLGAWVQLPLGEFASPGRRTAAAGAAGLARRARLGPCGRGNVDHLVVGPGGEFVLDSPGGTVTPRDNPDAA